MRSFFPTALVLGWVAVTISVTGDVLARPVASEQTDDDGSPLIYHMGRYARAS